RVGDLGFMLGIFGTWLVFQTTSIPEILAAAPGMTGSTIGFLGYRMHTMDILCILLFIGAMGKSAQLGLHTWLPDAMEGPTPVSALIHAATMVTAGVFMVCRLSPMFEAAPVALTMVIFVGAATCFFAATIGTTQWDIKRVIAYSTCSQLGYMFFAAGVGAYGAAMFHLFTHAFFKALLFLGAGSVIHAMHHEQDMRYYGGLRKKIPLTFYAMMAGTLAITGVGVLGFFGFAGFYSKDAILEAAFARGTDMAMFAFWAGAVAALLTSFYSWRLVFLTFYGKPRWIESEHIQHSVHKTPEEAGEDTTGGYQPHESPISMLIPLGVLTVGAILAGFVFKYPFIDGSAEAVNGAFWGDSIYFNENLIHALHAVPLWVKLTATFVMIIGFVTAWFAYIKDTSIPGKFVEQFRVIHRFVYNKWYFDELYNIVFVKPAFWLGRIFWKQGDEGTIDRFGPNGAAWLVQRGALVAKKVQSGYLNSYALIMLLGLVAAITWVLF
ncbi:MAG: NADH-quinone oxidoreductase subunit L, partial [Altererythrobacter sp.]|nr:NADH-quinone oxidoreductase subunit L [Altererythrobacter sp.]